MIIKLSPQVRPDPFEVVKNGSSLTINGETFDFSPMGDGDTLPRDAITSQWFDDNVEKKDGVLIITLLFPNPWNFSYAQAFPVPLVDVPDGPVAFPLPLSEEETLIKFPPSPVVADADQEAILSSDSPAEQVNKEESQGTEGEQA